MTEFKCILWYLLRVVAVISVQMFLNVLTVKRTVATVLFSPFYGVSDNSVTPAANTATTVAVFGRRQVAHVIILASTYTG